MASIPQDQIGTAGTADRAAIRLGKLASDVESIKTNVDDLRLDVRELRGKVDQCATRADLANVDSRLTKQLIRLDTKLDRSFLWMISFQIGIGGVLLGTMAHGFRWI